MTLQHGHDEDTGECASLERRLIALLDSGLSAGECASLRAEIEACPECFARLRVEEALRALLRSSCHRVRAPQGLRERVTYQIQVTRWELP